jgi:hypothetical protein
MSMHWCGLICVCASVGISEKEEEEEEEEEEDSCRKLFDADILKIQLFEKDSASLQETEIL